MAARGRKLFGIVNLVDLAVGCGVIGAVIIGVQSYRLLRTAQAPVPWRLDNSLEVFCLFDRLSEGVASQLRAGVVDRDPTGRTVIEILEVVSSRPIVAEAQLSPAMAVPTQSAVPLHRVLTRVRLFGDIREDGRLYCKGRPVTLGAPIEFRLERTILVGTISPGQEEEVFVYLRGSNVSGELANLLTPGDPVYDAQGLLSGEILLGEIIAANPKESAQIFGIALEQESQKGVYQVALTKPVHVVELWVKLRCLGRAPVFFFNGEPMKVGKTLVLQSDEYDFHGEIIQLSTAVPKQREVAEWSLRYVRLRATMLLEEIAELIKRGDVLYDVDGGPAGQIIWVVSLSRPTTSLSEGAWQVPVQQGLLNIPLGARTRRVELWVELRCLSRGPRVLFAGGALKVGNLLTLNSDRYDVHGRIVEIRETMPEDRRKP